jgi:Lar family restriction alleviation protein
MADHKCEGNLSIIQFFSENITEEDIRYLDMFTQLKPCPFCGSEDLEITERGTLWVDCNICGATVSFSFVVGGELENEGKLVREKFTELWNRRTK